VTALEAAELSRTPSAIALTLAIGVAYPLVGWWRFRRLERQPEPIPRGVKLRLYASIVASQWTLVALTALLLASAGLGLADLGQGPGRSVGRTVLVAGLLLAGFGVLSRVTLAQLAKATPEELPGHVRRAGRILPGDGVERGGFVAVAITAGVCEEILYRGWLPWAIAGWTGSPAAGFVVAALVFGAGHAYQGRNGMLLTGALGLFLGGVVAWTGSLLPGQFLHVAVDLVNGLAVGATLARHDAEVAAFAPTPEPLEVAEPPVSPSN
jgi:membrane protease YdiL (CAAX protease family)